MSKANWGFKTSIASMPPRNFTIFSRASWCAFTTSQLSKSSLKYKSADYFCTTNVVWMGCATRKTIWSEIVVIVLSEMALSGSDKCSFNILIDFVLCAIAWTGSRSSCRIALSAAAMARTVWNAAGLFCESSNETRRISWNKGKKQTRFWGFNCNDGAVNRTSGVSYELLGL